MPDLSQVRLVSRAVAPPAARAAVVEGLARLATTESETIERRDQATWEPVYGPVVAAKPQAIGPQTSVDYPPLTLGNVPCVPRGGSW